MRAARDLVALGTRRLVFVHMAPSFDGQRICMQRHTRAGRHGQGAFLRTLHCTEYEYSTPTPLSPAPPNTSLGSKETGLASHVQHGNTHPHTCM